MKPARNNRPFSEEDSRQPEDLSSVERRINDEDNLDTRNVSSEIEEGDEDYDDEQASDELTEADFEGEEEDYDSDDDEAIL